MLRTSGGGSDCSRRPDQAGSRSCRARPLPRSFVARCPHLSWRARRGILALTAARLASSRPFGGAGHAKITHELSWPLARLAVLGKLTWARPNPRESGSVRGSRARSQRSLKHQKNSELGANFKRKQPNFTGKSRVPLAARAAKLGLRVTKPRSHRALVVPAAIQGTPTGPISG